MRCSALKIRAWVRPRRGRVATESDDREALRALVGQLKTNLATRGRSGLLGVNVGAGAAPKPRAAGGAPPAPEGPAPGCGRQPSTEARPRVEAWPTPPVGPTPGLRGRANRRRRPSLQ